MTQRGTQGTALVYVRRSTGRQEASLPSQLRWARDEAPKHGVRIATSQADLDKVLLQRQHEHGDLYLDDGITGADLNRLGFTSMRRRALADKSVSYVFIHLPDRFARPEEAMEAALLDIELRRAGITLVFSNRVALPRLRGTSNFADDIQTLYQYHESGDFLRKLAQRIIEGQLNLAQKGYWTGGRPPYGFGRVLVDPAENVLQDLADGMHVRMDRCQVRLRVKDPNKVRVWVMILYWYDEEKIGTKRIANRLNDMGIPSPDAGHTRTDNGLTHKVSGRWNHRTVLSLIKNRAIIGISTYGVQSEGAHRRVRAGAPRSLDDSDIRLDGKPKVINNPEADVIVAPGGFAAEIKTEVFERCQALLKHRGRNQRGISRQRDPAKYPLAVRVFDMSRSRQLPGGCGNPMYGITSGDRKLYVCGRYMKTSGSECAHNVVDADATLAFVLKTLRQMVDSVGGRKALRQHLVALARNGAEQTWREPAKDAFKILADRAASLEEEAKAIARNFSRAQGDEELDLFREEYASVKTQLQQVQAQLDRGQATQEKDRLRESEIDREVDAALAVYEQIGEITNDAAARAEIPMLMDKLNLRLWLNFGEGKKGKRPVRILKGGLITTGAAELPMRPYGEDGDPAEAGGGVDSVSASAGKAKTPAVEHKGSRDSVSFTKVNRGDRI